MSKIKIKNFGPIKEGYTENDGWMDIKKVTVFIGNQGSGKSTVAKLISTFKWIEKAFVRGDLDYTAISAYKYFKYHKIHNYNSFSGSIFDNAKVEYDGTACKIKLDKEKLRIEEIKNKEYPLPQIMYVPSERNFIGSVKFPYELRLTSESLKEFLVEFDKAKNELRESIPLPINNVQLEYNKKGDILFINSSGFKVNLDEASSGFQSYVPLYIVSRFLAESVSKEAKSSIEPMSSDELERFRKGVADIWSNPNLTDEQKRVAISVLSSKFNKTAFINIVEEPEQNLYPTSQWEMLKSLLEFNNSSNGNKLIMTTHSPYIINFLTLAVKAYLLKDKLDDNAKSKLQKIIPLSSVVKPDDLVIYELDEKFGEIRKLDTYKGLPSDENQLNEKLGETNELFAQLLELEMKL